MPLTNDQAHRIARATIAALTYRDLDGARHWRGDLSGADVIEALSAAVANNVPNIAPEDGADRE